MNALLFNQLMDVQALTALCQATLQVAQSTTLEKGLQIIVDTARELVAAETAPFPTMPLVSVHTNQWHRRHTRNLCESLMTDQPRHKRNRRESRDENTRLG